MNEMSIIATEGKKQTPSYVSNQYSHTSLFYACLNQSFNV